MARKRWRHDVTMSSENWQWYLWIPCEFYSSLANQIMYNKQSALESWFKYDMTIVILHNHGSMTVQIMTNHLIKLISIILNLI